MSRLRVTGEVPAGPVILAANHISPVDPVVLMAACRTRRVAPRFLAGAEVFRMPAIGAIMRRCGHVPVPRGTAAVTGALREAAAVLAGGSVVLVYPEGRIGLDPGMWPERGKTGTARLALGTGAPVVPVAQWGAHELVPYSAPRGALRGLARALLRRPVLRVHFGPPVTLTDRDDMGDASITTDEGPPDGGRAGTARLATDRIIDALTAALAPLRPDEPDTPRHLDPTRPADTRRRHKTRPPPAAPRGGAAA